MGLRGEIRKEKKEKHELQNQKKADRIVYGIILGLILLAIITVAFYAVSM